MATEILVKDLRQAFKHASSTVRWQRLDVFADTTREASSVHRGAALRNEWFSGALGLIEAKLAPEARIDGARSRRFSDVRAS